MIPQEIIDKISDLPILDVANKLGVSPKKAGVNYVCHCPAHNEKTPSFTISPAKNLCKCFGCGVGGGPVQLVMLQEKMEWLDAVKWLAKAFNISIPKRELTAEEKQQYSYREQIMITNQAVLKYFTSNVKGEALKYISKRWDNDSIKQWGIGYAPDDWQGLENWAQKNGITKEALVKANLLTESKGRTFDFFRHRVIFPLHNRYGRIVGFSGRYIGDDPKQPKYLNTPENPAYNKSEVLYGIFLAQNEIRKQDNVFLVEGNPDVIKMHQVGAKNTVAPGGTSLTDEHLQEVKRHTSNITFVLETDNAGIKAVIKNSFAAIKQGFFVSVLALPEDGEKNDPDSYFESKPQFLGYSAEHTESFIVWYAYRILSTETNPGKRNKTVRDICELLAHLSDESTLENHLEHLKKLESPKSIWTKGVKAAKERNQEKEIEQNVKKSSDKDSFDKYGFIEQGNIILFTTKNGLSRAANFTLKPLFHVASITNSKRLYLMKNENGYEQIVELNQEDLIALSKFRKAVESRGNFIWEAGETELIRYKRYLYEQTDTCFEITQLGWQKDGFWAWGNGIFNGEFRKTDGFGIVSHNNINWYLPAFSKIWEGEKDHFQFERNFVYRTDGNISLYDYANLFYKVYGNNGVIGLCYLFAALFRDVIVKTTHNFPLLNMFGPKGAGKSEMGISLMSFFARRNKAPNLNNSTVPAINDAISQSCNALVHLDEYKNDLDFTKIELLKGIYDGTGRTRMNMDRDKKRETTAVDSGVMVSGQEMPTVDIALFSRLIFIAFHKTTDNQEEKKNFEALKEYDEIGLSHLTHQILANRDAVKKNWLDNYNETSRVFQEKLQGKLIEDRIFRNWLILATTFKTLESKLKLPFNYADVEDICVNGVIAQNYQTASSNELSNFWTTIDVVVSNGMLRWNVDFVVRHTTKLNTDKINSHWPEGKLILFINHTLALDYYVKHCKSKVLPKETMLYYLKNSREYLGAKAKHKFYKWNHDIKGFATKLDGSKQPKVTNVLCFEYSPLGLNIHEANPYTDDDSDINDNETSANKDAQQVLPLNPKQESDNKDELPF